MPSSTCPFHRHFALDELLPAGEVWLNTAHQGALPRVAAEAARTAVEWKLDPRQLTSERFVEVPRRVRAAAARLLGADLDDVVLTNGSSYGLHLLANGLPLRSGDEVLLQRGDFPSNLLPWLGLRERGVEVRLVEPRSGPVLEPEEVSAALSARTRVVCLSWVHSFSGWTTDLASIGKACRANGTWLVVNATQGIGTRPFDVATLPVDAVVCSGWKWLCGPYGTGFAWLRPELREALQYNQRYWLSMQTADELGARDDDPERRDPRALGARRYDLFGTANFFNFAPFAASLELLLELGVDAIAAHDRALVARLTDGQERLGYALISPRDPRRASSLVVLVPPAPTTVEAAYAQLTARGIHGALRRGAIR
ncbi:MAG TPA: aminotransferase class V-fold PLP-dependent enzyme, partial [Thermoanaerobaculia bacterium]|nr:aminotransferase class V-fold PLP-dependent enzyme [Thermoanaerobaculia bacterium]